MPSLAEDFYGKINKSQLELNKIPKNDVSISVFDKIEERMRHQIEDLLKHKSTGPLRAFVESVYNGRKHDLHALEKICATMTNFTTYEEFFSILGKLNLYGISSPLEFDISSDSRETGKYVIYLTEPGLDLIKEEILQNGSQFKEYTKYIGRVCKHLGDPDIANVYIDYIITACKDYYDYEDNFRIELTYNAMNFDQLLLDYPLMRYFFKICGDHEIKRVICVNPAVMRRFYSNYKRYDIATWKRLIRLNIYLSFMEDLPEPYESIFFDFTYKFLEGQQKPHSRDHKMFKICSEMCENAVGKLYLNSNLDNFAAIRNESTKLFKIVMGAAKKRVLKLNWLSESSRLLAHYKLENMTHKIGYPQVFEDDFAGVEISKTDYISNILNLNFDGSMKEIKKLTSGQDKRKWNNNCFAVNAYYYSELNEMCLPLGFLNPPFFSLTQSFVENLAGLGNIVAHEISHGFDEDGRKFDESGNYKPWWTSIDLEIYNSQTKVLIEEFDKQKYHGLKVSGELTLGENLADFGAMRICLDILEATSKEGSSKKQDLRDFFKAYTKTWLYKERIEKRKQAIKKDRHAPPQLRVNVILRHFDEFYDAFDIDEKDPGFIPVDQRIRIWG